ncbi:MAG: hypothetical protein QM774_05575 [Gordonia sp. (in: high G+C Gram-positive bacteria)]|uniref:hypothetical protein n=1 Tax=Gordonia sp. (in: high G+C Gram-positive bacteria) TaxID=84139 RepID=UPI0039E30CEF
MSPDADDTKPATRKPAKKAPAKKAPATKAPATKAPATKAPATKAAAKKASATKAAAGKASTAKATVKAEAARVEEKASEAVTAVEKKVDPSAAAPAADGAEASASSGGKDGITVSTSSLKKVGSLVAALLLLALLVVGGWQWWSKSRTLAAFDDSKAASAHYVTTYFNSMMAQGATAKTVADAVVPLSTGEAKQRAEEGAKSGVDYFDQMKLQNGQITVTSSMVESFDSKAAVTVLAADIKGTSALAPEGAEQAVLFQIHLVKQGGKWLVSNLEGLPGVTHQGEADSNGQTQAPQSGTPQTSDQQTQTPEPAPAG